MSSMLRRSVALLVLGTALVGSPAFSQSEGDDWAPPGRVVRGSGGAQQPAIRDGEEWDAARLRAPAAPRGPVAGAIQRWQTLSATDRLSFGDYASFLLSYPGYPEEEKIRAYAELALQRESVDASRLVAFFDRYPPVTNPARAQYALALATLRRPQARQTALDAWRGGSMSDAAYASIFSTYARDITVRDHDERMDALLWASDGTQAQRQVLYVSPDARPAFLARLALVNGQDPSAAGLPVSGEVLRDPGYIYNRVRQLRRVGNGAAATQLLANRPAASRPAREPTRMLAEILAVARGADAASAVRIAGQVDDLFPRAEDISKRGFKLRDDYTSLMWLGATKALWSLGDGARAAPLFYRYGASAQTPQTRSKGFYWAGRALARRSDAAGANRYFEMAAAYPDYFYGMLAAERLGRSVPRFDGMPSHSIPAADRAAFNAKPITQAVREVARGYEWRTTVRFFREIAEQAETESDYLLVAELAGQLGRRDLGVILGQEAHTDGLGTFQKISFPLIPTPGGANWTMVHAITRQESQFAMNARSHAGAQGLMQLMPATAREQAGKLGLSYSPDALTTDAVYNIQLGNGYFARMVDYYGGNVPLAVAAYNAGPGNVNRWLSSLGDPRTGSIEWVDWIERIPLSETRGYVQRVLENAVVYEAMNPDKARYSGANPLSRIMNKRTPG